MTDVANISSTFVVVTGSLRAETVPVTETLWADLDEKYGDFAGSSLISSFSFDADWPTWEIHPKGDEFVCLLSGAAEMILALPDGDRSVRLTERGSFVIVPEGIWHTAKILAPTRMLFVTPGQGTENRKQPPRTET